MCVLNSVNAVTKIILIKYKSEHYKNPFQANFSFVKNNEKTCIWIEGDTQKFTQEN